MHGFVRLTAAAGIALSLLHAAPANALVDMQCSGTVNQTWTPGLQLLTSRAVNYTNVSRYDQCLPNAYGIQSGEINVSACFVNSCLLNVGPSEATIQWSDGNASTFTFQGVGASTTGNAQVFTSLGTVTSGLFQGDQVVLVNAFVSTGLLPCLSFQGLTSLAGTTTLTFTRL
jgi:hypothetical protein